MNPFIAMGRAGALAALATVLASCSLLGDAWNHKREPDAAQPAGSSEPPPVATHRFEIEPERDDVVGIVQVTTTGAEDTLSDIARRFNVGYEEIVRTNPGVDPWLPGAGRQIVVPSRFILPDAPREGIVINVAAMRIFYYPPRKHGEPQIVYTHPIGIGKVGWATPEGVTKITRRQLEPTWRPTASIIAEHRKNGEELEAIVGPGPDNPLGRHAMYLAWPSYLIHGTNKPYGVGLRSSHGCIRLYPEDIAQLFEIVPVGAKVRVVNQPFVFGWDADELHLQAYDVLEDDPRDWKKAQKKLLSKSLAARIQKELKRRGEVVNWDLISTLAHQPRGIPVPITRADASLDQVLASALKVQNRVPEGSNWDGVSDLPVDEKTFQEMLSDSDPAAPAPGAARKTGT
ncbi:MAG TPA: L,D-transpeptidase family protein [Steroidobacteraceae bacterium]|nr:L,D-transpeptidase family protein [Steroidobacteraceae bacterium]